MFKSIAAPTYNNNNSCIHKLDPRIKFLALLGLICASFCSILGLGLVFAITFLAIALGRISYAKILKALYSLKWLFIFGIIFHVFFTPGRYIFTGWRITYEGLYMGILISLRLALLIMNSSILMLTTSPIRLTQGLESMLSPLKRLGLPTAALAMMITLAMQFVPVLFSESHRLLMAQKARGIIIGEGNIIQKARNALVLILPLIIGAERKAENVALAMHIRGYSVKRTRSRLHPFKLYHKDYIVVAMVMLVMIISCF